MIYKKALVTGGAGFIGSHLAHRLIAKGIETVIVDNLSTGKISNIPKQAEFIKGDILDIDLLRGIITNRVDIVFHEAANVSIRNSIDNFFSDVENNLMGTVSLLQAIAGSGVKKFIFASSMAVYADCPRPVAINERYPTEPISPYGISKLASEKYILTICNNLGVDSAILRYFNTYGIRQTFTPYVGVITIFINKLLNGEPPIIFGDGQQKRDFVSVKDIVDANIAAMISGISGEIFNIGTGKGTTVTEIARVLCKAINPSIDPVYSHAKAGELRNSVADISKAKKMLGYSPKINLEIGILEVIEYIKSIFNK